MIVDETIFDADIYIEGCSIVCCERGRKNGCVACYIKHDICCSTKNILSKNIEVTFVDLLLPKTKAISVGIALEPLNAKIFLQLFAEIFNSLNKLKTRYLYSVTRI